MALSLNLSIEERNDNTALIIKDITSTDKSTGWGVGSNPSYTAIDNVSYSLGLVITITTSDGVSTTYDSIDLYDEFGAFTAYEDMTFVIDPTLLLESTVAAFTSTDVMPDGIYDFTYTFTDIGAGTYTATYTVMKLVNGVVTNGCYELLRANNASYDDSLLRDDRSTREAMFAYSYLVGMKASEFSAKREELLTQLFTLERMITNGSNNSW